MKLINFIQNLIPLWDKTNKPKLSAFINIVLHHFNKMNFKKNIDESQVIGLAKNADLTKVFYHPLQIGKQICKYEQSEYPVTKERI